MSKTIVCAKVCAVNLCIFHSPAKASILYNCMYSINYKAITEHNRTYKEYLANQHIIISNKDGYAILNNQIQLVSESGLFSFTTSVLSHWLPDKSFVLSLYKYDTSRIVGRPIYSTARRTSCKGTQSPGAHSPLDTIS